MRLEVSPDIYSPLGAFENCTIANEFEFFRFTLELLLMLTETKTIVRANRHWIINVTHIRRST